jgi:hypothetical protein
VRAGIERPSPAQTRLNSFDGRPVYRFGGGGGGRGAAERVVYADTGEEKGEVSRFQRNRIAAAWTGQPADQARVESIREIDQWTVQAGRRDLRPLFKYSWRNGEQVDVNGSSGEVVQYTTTATRLAAHVSAIPHWVYYTPLRKRQPVWIAAWNSSFVSEPMPPFSPLPACLAFLFPALRFAMCVTPYFDFC